MKENNWLLYQHTCPDGKVYIGITSRSAEERWQNGLGYKGSQKFFSAIVKYGWENIDHKILKESLGEEEARTLERNLIRKLKENTYNTVYCIAENNETSIATVAFDKNLYSPDELFAINLWSIALYGDGSDFYMQKVADENMWKRTIIEFASGDYERIAKELIYIDHCRSKRLKTTPTFYSVEKVKKILEKGLSCYNEIEQRGE